MSIVWWLIVAMGLFLALSVVVGLAVAAILGQIGREVSELFESAHWASAPLARETGDDAEREVRPSRGAVGSPLR
jgi:hypothetical protein